MRISWILLVITACSAILCLPAPAQTPLPALEPLPENDEQSPDNLAKQFGVSLVGLMDRTHGMLSNSVVGTSEWFDNFFGDKRVEEESLGTRIKLTNSLTLSEQGRWENRVRVRAKMSLPNLKRRVKIIFTRETDMELEDELRGQTDKINAPTATTTDEAPKTTSALRWIVRQKRKYRINVDVGARFRFPLEPFAKIRYRRNWALPKDWELTATETGFWRKIDGFGETTRLDFKKQLSEDLLLRLSPSATYSETSAGVNWAKEVTFFKDINQRTAVSLDYTMAGHTRPGYRIKNHRLGLRFRQNIWRPWIFYELEPEVNYADDVDWEPEGVMTFRVELLFGAVKTK